MASSGPRAEAAAFSSDARAAAIEQRLAERECVLRQAIDALEERLAASEGPGGDASGSSPDASRRKALEEGLAGLRRERYAVCHARDAIAVGALRPAATLARLRDGFTPAEEHAPARNGAGSRC